MIILFWHSQPSTFWHNHLLLSSPLGFIQTLLNSEWEKVTRFNLSVMHLWYKVKPDIESWLTVNWGWKSAFQTTHLNIFNYSMTKSCVCEGRGNIYLYQYSSRPQGYEAGHGIRDQTWKNLFYMRLCRLHRMSTLSWQHTWYHWWTCTNVSLKIDRCLFAIKWRLNCAFQELNLCSGAYS